MNKKNNIRSKALTSIRFFAIMIIVVHHTSSLIQISPKAHLGNVGVTFFFVLSSFVLTLNYRSIATFREAAVFMWNRFIRIYPIHILTFILSIGVIVLWKFKLPIDTSLSTGILNLLLMHSYCNSSAIYFSFNSPSWALSTLFSFYIIFAFIILKPYKNGIIVFLVLCISFIASLNYMERHNLSQLEFFWLFQVFPLNRFIVFSLGMIASYMFIKLYNNVKSSTTLISGSILECIVFLVFIDRITLKIIYNFIFKVIFLIMPAVQKPTYAFIIDSYFVTPIICLMLIYILGLEQGVISRILSFRIFTKLGEISFSIYMSHQLIFRLLALWKKEISDICSEILLVIIAYGLVICISFVLFKFIEDPIRIKFKKKLSQPN